MANTSLFKITKRYIYEVAKHVRYRLRQVVKPTKINHFDVTLEINRNFSPKVIDIIYRNRYEADEARCLLSRVEPDDIVLEFGAGVGFLSTLCAKKIGSNRIFCYEANPKLIEIIRNTYTLNNVKPTFVHAMLVVADNPSQQFSVNEDFLSSSTLPRPGQVETVLVPTRDLNAEIKQIQPTFLIMDVEGAEYDLIHHTDLSNIRKIVVEVHPQIIGWTKVNQVKSHLTTCGFTIDPVISNGAVLYLEKLHLSQE